MEYRVTLEIYALTVTQSSGCVARGPLPSEWNLAMNSPLRSGPQLKNDVSVSSSQISQSLCAATLSNACGRISASPTLEPRISRNPCGP